MLPALALLPLTARTAAACVARGLSHSKVAAQERRDLIVDLTREASDGSAADQANGCPLAAPFGNGVAHFARPSSPAPTPCFQEVGVAACIHP
jgi:hypothetical protein